MMNFSLYGKKRVPMGGMNRVQILQQHQKEMMARAATMSRVNVPNVSVTPLVEADFVNECKSEEKDIIIYSIGCEEPMPVVEEPVIETLHNLNDHHEEEAHEGEAHEEEAHEEEAHEEEAHEGEAHEGEAHEEEAHEGEAHEEEAHEGEAHEEEAHEGEEV
jgi:hypothetical protein